MQKRFHGADLWFALAIFLLSGLLFFLFYPRTDGTYLEVRENGRVTGVYSLSVDGEYTLSSAYGENVFVIQNGRVFMKSASCPDKCCTQSGEKSRVNESIVCLPNRVSLTVLGSDTGEVDAVE